MCCMPPYQIPGHQYSNNAEQRRDDQADCMEVQAPYFGGLNNCEILLV